MTGATIDSALLHKIRAARMSSRQQVIISAIDIAKLQQGLRRICRGSETDFDEVELKIWEELIRNPTIFEMIHKSVPQLDVTDANVPHEGDGGVLGRMLRALKGTGLLRRAPSPPSDPIKLDHFQIFEDMMYALFPSHLHSEIHDFVTEAYNIQAPFYNIRATANGENSHTHALLDRIFQKISAIWLDATKMKGTPGYWRFDTAYRRYRGQALGEGETVEGGEEVEV